MFAPEIEAILATLTVEQREVAEDRLQSWEEVLIDDGHDVTPAQQMKTLHQIVAEFNTGYTWKPIDMH